MMTYISSRRFSFFFCEHFYLPHIKRIQTDLILFLFFSLFILMMNEWKTHNVQTI